ncbi:MAG: polysaccharide pyruvyl transferase family protein [Nitrososphaerales archaeon]
MQSEVKTAQKRISPREHPRYETRRVILSGWYGQENLGDEVILQSLVSGLRSRIGPLSISVLSEKPEVIRESYGLRSLRKTNRVLDTVRKILEISRADIFILGGGGILMDYGDTNHNVSKWLKDMRIAQSFGVPTMACGIGVGKIWVDESKKLISEVLSRADRICVRDEHSSIALSTLGVHGNVILAADAALLLPQLEKFNRRRSRGSGGPTIVVCLRHWYVTRNETVNEEVFDGMKASLARLLSDLSSIEHATIKFVPLCSFKRKNDDDTEVAQEVMELMGNPSHVIILEHVPIADEFIQILNDSDLLIGMRLHSLILASAAQVPCIGLNYDDKVINFMSSIGSSDWTLSLDEANYENLRRLVDSALKQSGQNPIITNLIEERKRAARVNIDIAVELLQTHHSPRRQKVRRYPIAIFLIARRIFDRLKEFASRRPKR